MGFLEADHIAPESAGGPVFYHGVKNMTEAAAWSRGGEERSGARLRDSVGIMFTAG